MDFHAMKRKELQALCKKHGIPANLTNREMADRLASLLKEDEEPITKGLGEIESEIDSVVITKNVKKVRFSPENETFIFVGTDVDSDSDSDYNSKSKKKNSRKRRSTSNNLVKKKKNVEENPVRVTRSRVTSVVEDDSKVASLAFSGKKRGRRSKEIVDVCDKPPPEVDLGDDGDGFTARAESKIEEVTRQLRSRKVVIEAGRNGADGDLAVPSKKISLRGSKKTRDGKGSNGVLSVNETFEEKIIAEAANPRKIPKLSKRNLMKDEGSNCTGNNGIGGRTRRSQTRINGNASAVDGECGIVETRKESRKVLQLEEPVIGIGRNSLRRKSVAGKKEGVVSELVAGIEHEPVLKKESRKRSKKTVVEDVSKIEPIGDAMKQLLSDGPSRRTRRNTSLFSPAASTTNGKLTTHEAAGRMKPSREVSMVNGADIIAKPLRKSTRNASRQISTEISDKLGEVAENVKKCVRKKKAQELILNKESSVIVHEPVNYMPRGRSTRNISKGKMVELSELTPRVAGKNKQHKARKIGKGSFTKTTLALKEPPVTDGLAAAVASISRTDPDLFCNKEGTVTSGEKTKGLRRKSSVTSQLSPVRVSAVNNEVVEITSNLVIDITPKFVVDIAPSLEVLVSASVVESIVKGNESNIVEEGEDNFFNKNVEGFGDNHLCNNSSNTNAVSGDNRLVEPMEYPNKRTDVRLNSPVNGLSPTYHADSEGECSNLLDINEGLETEQGQSINTGTDEDQYIAELDPNRNLETVQDHLDEVNESRKLERTSDKSSLEAEEVCPDVCYDNVNEKVQEIRFGNIVPSNIVAVPCEPSPESQDENVLTTSVKMCLDHGIEKGVFKEEGEPGSPSRFNFEKLQEGKECESPSASVEIASAACEVIKQASNQVVKEASKECHIHQSVISELNRGASFAAHNLVSMDEKANVEDKLEDGKECESLIFSNEIAPLSCEVTKEASNEVMQTVPQTQQQDFGELDNHKDVALELNRDASFSFHNLMFVDDKANVEDKLEKLQEEKECESPGGSNETASLSREVIKEASKKVMQTLLQIQQPHLSELDNHKDVALELNRSASFSAHNLMAMDGKANVEDELGRMDSESNTKDYSERERENDVVVVTNVAPCNTGTCLVEGGLLDIDDSDHGVVLNLGHDNVQVPQAEADATCTDEKVDCNITENANKWKEEYSSKVEVSIDISCESPEACSRFGDEYGSHNTSGDRNDTKETEATTEYRGDKANSKSRGCRSNENLLVSYKGLNQETAATTSEFSQALLSDRKGAGEDAAFVNDIGTENDTKQTEEILDNKITESDGVKDVGVLENSSLLSPVKPNMDVDCFVSSPDDRNSEVQSAAISNSDSNMDFGKGGKDEVEKIYEVLAEANLEGEHGEKHKEVEETLIMNEQFDRVAERQFAEYEHPSDSTVSKDESPAQDDVSAIIQEYLDHETHMDEFIRTKDCSDFVHGGRMTDAAEIKGYESGAVEDAEPNNVAELGIDNMLEDSGEKNKEAYAMTTETTKLGEENGSLLLPKVDGIELSEVNDAALGDSNDIVSVKHEDSETPNEIVETMSHNDEIKFGDIEGSVSMASDNSLFSERRTQNSEVNTCRMVDGSNSQVTSVHAETELNLDVVLNVTADDVSDNLVEDELHAGNDNGSDTILVNSQENKIVSKGEVGDESVDQRVAFDNVEDSTKLARTAIGRTLTGKESPCQAYNNLVTEGLEVKEMVNTERGTDLKNVDSPLQRNNEIGTDQRGSGCHRSMFEQGEQTEDVDCLDLSILFSSNNSNINPKRTGETLDLHSPEGMEVSSGASKDTAHVDVLAIMDLSNLFSSNNSKISSNKTGETFDLCSPEDFEVSYGASKDTADVEEVLSIMKPEKGVQCSDVCLLTASASECVQSTPGENKALKSHAEMSLSACFELNLHSEDSGRDEVEKFYATKLKDHLMGESAEKVKNGEDTVVSISEVSEEQLHFNDNAMVVEGEIQKQNHLAVSGELIYENEELKQKGTVSVITQGCLDIHKDESFNLDASTEAVEISGSISTALMEADGEDINSLYAKGRTEDKVATVESNKDASELNAENMNAASDEPISENGGSKEKGKPSAECGANHLNQVEYYLKTSVEDVSALIMDDPSEDITTELSKDVSVMKATSMRATSDEPVVEKMGTEEESNDLSDFKGECVDCDYHKDDSVGSDSSIETTETNGCRSDSKQVEVHVNSDSEGTQFPGRSNVNEGISEILELSNKDESALKEIILDQFLGKSDLSEDISETMELSKSDLELKGTTADQLSSTIDNVVSSENSKTWPLKLESPQENVRESNLLESISESAIAKDNNNCLVPATPKIRQKFHDMKENLPSTKREQVGNMTAPKRSQRRRPLEDLLNNQA